MTALQTELTLRNFSSYAALAFMIWSGDCGRHRPSDGRRARCHPCRRSRTRRLDRDLHPRCVYRLCRCLCDTVATAEESVDRRAADRTVFGFPLRRSSLRGGSHCGGHADPSCSRADAAGRRVDRSDQCLCGASAIRGGAFPHLHGRQRGAQNLRTSDARPSYPAVRLRRQCWSERAFSLHADRGSVRLAGGRGSGGDDACEHCDGRHRRTCLDQACQGPALRRACRDMEAGATESGLSVLNRARYQRAHPERLCQQRHSDPVHWHNEYRRRGSRRNQNLYIVLPFAAGGLRGLLRLL